MNWDDSGSFPYAMGNPSFWKGQLVQLQKHMFHVSHEPVALDGFGFMRIIFEVIFLEHIVKLSGIKSHTTQKGENIEKS
jgi:hypothetical protein